MTDSDITTPTRGKRTLGLNSGQVKRPKAIALRASVPTVRSPTVPAVRSPPKVPATKAKPGYAAFDDYVAVAEHRHRLLDQWDALIEDQAKKEPLLPLDEAERTADLWLSDILRADRKFEKYRRYFERPELYRPAEERANWLCETTYKVLADKAIGEQVALLLTAFPSAAPGNPQAFSRLLVEEIKVARPYASALEACCRHLRRTMKFLPALSEVLAELRKQMVLWHGDGGEFKRLGVGAEDFCAMHRRFVAGLVEKKKTLAGCEVAAEPTDAPAGG